MLLCPLHWSVSGVVLDQRSLDRAGQLSQWFSSPLYYYSSDWRESVSSWGPASFMTTCSPFRQKVLPWNTFGTCRACILIHIQPHIDFKHLYFIVERGDMLRKNMSIAGYLLNCLTDFIFFPPLLFRWSLTLISLDRCCHICCHTCHVS